MSNNCGKCKKPASNRDLIRCYGKCKTGYHPTCVDYKMDSWSKMFKECPYAKFVCFECQNDIEYSTTSDLLGLKEQLFQLSQSVLALTCKVDAGFEKFELELADRVNLLNQSAVTKHPIFTGVNVQPEVATDDATISANRRINLPLSDCIIGSCHEMDETIKTVPDRKFVYASRFSNNTVPEAICKFLSGKLAVSESEFECRLLVSANQDISRFNYISFKIGVHPDLFSKLLRPEVWPTGVLVREFVSRPKNLTPANMD